LLTIAVGTAFGGVGPAGGADEARLLVRYTAPVYAALAVLAAIASRNVYFIVERSGSEARAARDVWLWLAITYGVLTILGALGFLPGVVVAFLALHVLHNVWRPVHVSRLSDAQPSSDTTTVLSVESQARRLSTMALAPVIGAAVDGLRSYSHDKVFWPLGVAGLLIAMLFWLMASATSARDESAAKVSMGMDPR
jgi:hypothetical protein